MIWGEWASKQLYIFSHIWVHAYTISTIMNIYYSQIFLILKEHWRYLCLHLHLKLHVCLLSHFSCIQLFVTPWTVARLAPLSVGFSRQEYCSGLPFPSPGDLPDSGMEPSSLCLLYHQVGYLPLVQPGNFYIYICISCSLIWGPMASCLYHYLHFHKKVLLYHNFLLKIVVLVQC